MAKVTARDAEGNEVVVLQAQFNNYGQVESFLTKLESGHQVWVHASEYDVTVDEDADMDAPDQGIMSSKDTSLKTSKVVKKRAPRASRSRKPAAPKTESTPPAAPPAPTEPPVPAQPVAPTTPPPAKPVPPVQ